MIYWDATCAPRGARRAAAPFFIFILRFSRYYYGDAAFLYICRFSFFADIAQKIYGERHSAFDIFITYSAQHDMMSIWYYYYYLIYYFTLLCDIFALSPALLFHYFSYWCAQDIDIIMHILFSHYAMPPFSHYYYFISSWKIYYSSPCFSSF